VSLSGKAKQDHAVSHIAPPPEPTWSPRAHARLIGGLYLVGIALGLFAEIVVRGGLTVWSDAAQNAAQIQGGEQLYRLGFAAGVAILLINVPMAAIFYRLFKPASETAALIIAFAILVGSGIEGSTLLNHYAPLVLLGESQYLQGMALEERQVLALAAVRTFSIGYGVALTFYALYDIAAGCAILKSRIIPRVIGVLMVAAGLCYLTNSFALFVAPSLAIRLYPFILLPCFIGELSLALWLLVVGVHAERWRAAAQRVGLRA
jgi:hypothetical protein